MMIRQVLATVVCCVVLASVVSDSVQPHRQQPIRLPRPWGSPGKNTGVGCHFLLQCMTVKSESEVVQSCPTLSDPMDCSLPGSSVHVKHQVALITSQNYPYQINCVEKRLTNIPKFPCQANRKKRRGCLIRNDRCTGQLCLDSQICT